MTEKSVEQRARDGRLAWIIVGCCAIVCVTLVAVLSIKLFGYAVRSFEQSQREQQADLIRERRERFAATAPPIPPDTARPVGDPARWLTPANRPAAALARGEHGAVRVTLTIGADGAPTGCSIAESSGFYALDNGTCQALLWAGDFEPARRGEAGAQPGEVRRWTSPIIEWDKVR